MSSLRRLFANLNPATWLSSRNWKAFIPALPACIVAALILTPWFMGRFETPATAQRYQQAINQALLKNDMKTASLYAKKLASLGFDEDPDVQLLSAMNNGELEMDDETLSRFAPDDAIGHGRAHFLRAQRIAKQAADDAKSQRDLLLHHLKSAVLVEPSLTDAHAMLGSLYLNEGNTAEAVPHLEAAKDGYPSLALSLGKIYLSNGSTAHARSALTAAEIGFREKLEKTEAPLLLELQLADALCGLKRFKDSRDLLEQAKQKLEQHSSPDLRDKNAQAIDVAIAQVDLHWTKHDVDQPSPSLQNQTQAIDRLIGTLDVLPKSTDAEYVLVRTLNQATPRALSAYHQLHGKLTPENSEGLVLCLMGACAMREGDAQQARSYIEQAYQSRPKEPAILNNMAFLISQDAATIPERALALANEAVELAGASHPGVANFRETRGQIFAKMEKWQDAKQDLEFAAQSITGNRDLHLTLALVYEKLGDLQAAQKQKSIAAYIADNAGN